MNIKELLKLKFLDKFAPSEYATPEKITLNLGLMRREIEAHDLALLKAVLEIIGEDTKLSPAPVEDGRHYPDTQAIKVRAVQQATNIERQRIKSLIEEVIK